MDCRKSLLWAAGLCAGALGCTSAQVVPMAQNKDGQLVEVHKDDDTKRPPKPSTLVAYGRLCEQTAAEPTCTQPQRERLQDQARRCYQQAIEHDSKNAPALTALAHLYVQTGEKDKAVETYKRGLKCQPKSGPLWFELGVCQARFKEWKPALEALKKATELEPENKQFHNQYGYCLARAGHHDDSLKAFRKCGTEADAHYNLARMLSHLQDAEKSKHHLRVALHHNPELVSARELLARLETAPTPGADPAAVTPVSHETAAPQP
jgi:tetratricopeptide (TPR) repeat protein